MQIQLNTWNFSSAFNPSRLAPVEHSHVQGHTLMETDAIHWSGGHPITAPGGVRRLAQGHLSRGEEVDSHPSSCQFTNLWVARVGIKPPTFRILDDPLSNGHPEFSGNSTIIPPGLCYSEEICCKSRSSCRVEVSNLDSRERGCSQKDIYCFKSNSSRTHNPSC